MCKENIVRYTRDSLPEDKESDWDRVKAMTEDEIMEAALSDPDAQPTDAEFWKNAKLVMPEPKQRITLRIDKDVIEWFRRDGKGYQTRINAVLRAYVAAQKSNDRDG